MISKEAEEKICQNNIKISDLLKENEIILVQEGLNVPDENFAPVMNEKINIPSEYIRTNDAFQKKYHLKEIILDHNVRKNIAYSLQLSDFYNYLINRFYIWGSVETMLFKSAIINFVSVFESLVLECANNICSNTANCSETKRCYYHFSQKQRNNSYNALCKLNSLNVTNFSEEELERIKEIIELRNKVHIRLSTENEYISGCFSLELYNEVVELLKQTSDMIYNNGVSLYEQKF